MESLANTEGLMVQKQECIKEAMMLPCWKSRSPQGKDKRI